MLIGCRTASGAALVHRRERFNRLAVLRVRGTALRLEELPGVVDALLSEPSPVVGATAGDTPWAWRRLRWVRDPGRRSRYGVFRFHCAGSHGCPRSARRFSARTRPRLDLAVDGGQRVPQQHLIVRPVRDHVDLVLGDAEDCAGRGLHVRVGLLGDRVAAAIRGHGTDQLVRLPRNDRLGRPDATADERVLKAAPERRGARRC